MIDLANRLQHVEEYYFSKKLKEVRAMTLSGIPVINLGIGSPDLQPPRAVKKAIADSLENETAHKYQSYQGLPEFRQAIARFYKSHFNTNLSWQTEILPLMGSKEGIMHISMAFLNPDDEVLIPNPGYPTYTAVTKLVSAKPVYYDLKEDNGWLPDLKALEASDLSKVKLMWINYPHMPSGKRASKLALEQILKFGEAHNILIVNDNPYSFILNDNPQSILSVAGTKGHFLELNSLSKTFNMAGWRVGMVLGQPDLIDAITKVKTNMDSGMFYGIQKGAIEALNSSNLWFGSLNSIYLARRQKMWELVEKINCQYDPDTSGLFVWAKLPNGIDDVNFAEVLLKKHHIFCAPGSVFGSNGKGYLRFSLCVPIEDIDESIIRV